ncbi:S9 family peptidase [Hyphococcus sp.]|uniref:S9 family peptidase n=1 Tax=Hyphococcus sp. TaxID=2038636 RepID=UPI00208D4878|nr:MAG: prolyl oligopeptidase [Marinicaulis sp.]
MSPFARALLSFISLLYFATGAASAQPADPAVYGALPGVKEMQISPDGKTLASLQNAGGASGVLFYDLDNPGSQPVGVGLGDSDARDIVWANNDQLLLLVSQSSNVSTNTGIKTIEFFRWVTVSKSKAKAKILLGNEAGYFVGSAGDLLALMPNDPKKAIFARHSAKGVRKTTPEKSRLANNDVQPFVYSLFLVDVESGAEKRLETGNEQTIDWVVNEQGEAIMRIDLDPTSRTQKIYYRKNGEDRLTAIDDPEGNLSGFDYYGRADRPDTLFASAYANDKTALFEVNMATGKSTIAYANPSYDSDVVYDARTATVTGVRYIDDMARTHHLNEADRTMQENLRKAIPGSAPIIISKSADGNRLIVKVTYSDHPPQFYLFDKQARSLGMVAATYALLDGTVAAKKEKYEYTTADGMKIPGYLTVPAGAVKQNMPMIVLPHGGPNSRSDQAFDYWSFFYAARGYLVYEPNFRGSEGYGRQFLSAGYGEWGRKMQDDITHGVQKLIADGVVDQNRICIVGASYGGYAALAGATLTPDLYRCAVSVNGVSNLAGMLGEASESTLGNAYWSRRIGDRFRDAEEIAAVSPASIAKQSGAPILLIVSKDDVVVQPYQSTQMRDALRRAGKPVEFVEMKGEDHWLSTAAARTEMLQRSIEFIDRYIGGQ